MQAVAKLTTAVKLVISTSSRRNWRALFNPHCILSLYFIIIPLLVENEWGTYKTWCCLQLYSFCSQWWRYDRCTSILMLKPWHYKVKFHAFICTVYANINPRDVMYHWFTFYMNFRCLNSSGTDDVIIITCLCCMLDYWRFNEADSISLMTDSTLRIHAMQQSCQTAAVVHLTV